VWRLWTSDFSEAIAWHCFAIQSRVENVVGVSKASVHQQPLSFCVPTPGVSSFFARELFAVGMFTAFIPAVGLVRVSMSGSGGGVEFLGPYFGAGKAMMRAGEPVPAVMGSGRTQMVWPRGGILSRLAMFSTLKA
jgi:hypothetical protein